MSATQSVNGADVCPICYREGNCPEHAWWPHVTTIACRKGNHSWCGLSKCECICHIAT